MVYLESFWSSRILNYWAEYDNGNRFHIILQNSAFCILKTQLYLQFNDKHKSAVYSLYILMIRRLNCSSPIPPGHPWGHHFFVGCPGIFITLFLPCPALYKHYNHSFFQCPTLFYHANFSSDPVAAPGGDGGRTIWPAHKWNTETQHLFLDLQDRLFVVVFFSNFMLFDFHISTAL